MTEQEKMRQLTGIYLALGQKPPENWPYVADAGCYIEPRREDMSLYEEPRWWPASTVDWNAVHRLIDLAAKEKQWHFDMRRDTLDGLWTIYIHDGDNLLVGKAYGNSPAAVLQAIAQALGLRVGEDT